MALKFLTQFTIFAPLPPDHHRAATTEVHFSRWNNANAEKFIRQERTQKEIEDELRFIKRFNSADKITKVVVPPRSHIASPTPTFKSTGSPSSPSRPSIPAKFSKYSKSTHPAFQQIVRPRKLPNNDVQTQAGIKVSDNGVSYVVPEAPFEFQYSYTETPKAKPLKLREPPIAPFGPETMPRPWTGRKPLAPSTKKLEFDSFKLPPAHKKGIKPVQAPGPFLPGSGPRYVRTREEILGEPLSKEEIDDLVDGCMKSKRQLNMGRDGLTHNMLDNIHALWKRRRVCKIKCRGVCTVDMDNVRKQLEEKTGGKIIRSNGGVIFLFRGRNYNFKTRPVFPLMLWKPVTPVYPRLVKRSPEGLTLDEANEMRKKGRQLIPITKLGKNGVYCDLVKNVREAFEASELVRIDCQGMNGSDYRKIGAKLKDLVPCVLISFESEHILMWRGRDWKSLLPEIEDEPREVKETDSDDVAPIASLSTLSTDSTTSDNGSNEEYLSKEEGEDFQVAVDDSHSHVTTENFDIPSSGGEGSERLKKSVASTHHTSNRPEYLSTVPSTDETSRNLSGNGRSPSEIMSRPQTEKVLLLLKQAVDGGSAVVLDDSSLDADIVYQKAVALAKSAPPEPAFRRRTKKVATEKFDVKEAGDKKVATQMFDAEEAGDQEVEELFTVSKKRTTERSHSIQRKMDSKADSYLAIVPQGSLRVDELAKLLA